MAKQKKARSCPTSSSCSASTRLRRRWRRGRRGGVLRAPRVTVTSELLGAPVRGMMVSDRNVVEAFARQSFLSRAGSSTQGSSRSSRRASMKESRCIGYLQEVLGETLAARLGRSEPLDPAECVRLIREIADVFDYLHRHMPQPSSIARSTRRRSCSRNQQQGEAAGNWGTPTRWGSVASTIDNLPRAPEGFRRRRRTLRAQSSSRASTRTPSRASRASASRHRRRVRSKRLRTGAQAGAFPDPNARFPSAGRSPRRFTTPSFSAATHPMLTLARSHADAKPCRRPGPGPRTNDFVRLPSAAVHPHRPQASKAATAGNSPPATPATQKRSRATMIRDAAGSEEAEPAPAASAAPAGTPLGNAACVQRGDPRAARLQYPPWHRGGVAVDARARSSTGATPGAARATRGPLPTSGTTAKWAPVGGHYHQASPAVRGSLPPEPIAPSEPAPAETAGRRDVPKERSRRLLFRRRA